MSGTGGTIVDPASPTSQFQGTNGTIYTLSWTITNACNLSVDEVVISFAYTGSTCGGTSMVDSRDGQTYNIVQIGTQCWMAENLNIGTKINSTTGGYQQTDNDVIEKYCHSNNEANCDIYGGLYEWPEAMQYIETEGAQGICPAGWHLPTDDEWKILEGTVDSEYPVGDPVWDQLFLRGFDAGGNLKEAGTTHWQSTNEGATNSTGFTGLPGGYRDINNGSFGYLGYYGYFWSSSQRGSANAWSRILYYNSANVSRNYGYEGIGFSVRCLKDD